MNWSNFVFMSMALLSSTINVSQAVRINFFCSSSAEINSLHFFNHACTPYTKAHTHRNSHTLKEQTWGKKATVSNHFTFSHVPPIANSKDVNRYSCDANLLWFRTKIHCVNTVWVGTEVWTRIQNQEKKHLKCYFTCFSSR